MIRGITYRPRWSLEIEAIGESAPDALPADCDAGAARMIADAAALT